MRSLFAVPVFAPGAGAAASAVIPTAGDASSAVVIPTATTKQLKTEAEKQKEKGGDELKKQLEGQREKLQEYGIKINWDNITVDDLAILALLSAFLVVMAGPGALALPVAIAAFRTLSIERGWQLNENQELKKTPSTTPSEPVADQLKQEKTCSTTCSTGVA